MSPIEASPILAERDDESLLRQACRQVLEHELPIARVRALTGDRDPALAAWWRQVAELGWTGVALPEAHGGSGLGLRELAVLAEEHGRAVQPGPFLSSAVCGLALVRLAPPEVRAALLPAMAAGDLVGAWSVDVDATAGCVVASPSGAGTGGGVHLRGARRLVAEASMAQVLLVDALDHRGQAVLASVPLDAAGLSMRPMTTIDLTRTFVEVTFDDVAVAPDRLLGGHQPAAARQDLADVGTVVQCAESIGAAGRLLEMTVTHARERHQFGRPIGSFQAIKHRLADMRVQLQAGRAALRYAAWAVQEQRPDATRAASIAKQWIGGSTSWIASEALQVHGGIGFTWEHDLHLFLRRLKANELTLGSPDWHARRLGDALDRSLDPDRSVSPGRR